MLSVEYRNHLAEPDPFGASLKTKIGFKVLWVRNCVISGPSTLINNFLVKFFLKLNFRVLH
jgi:hypothetical protein